MKKLLSLILIFIMIMSCIGCQENVVGGDGSGSSQTTEEQENDLILASNGTPIYKIIRFIDASEQEVDIVVDFKKRLKEQFEINFSIETDWSAPGKEPAADAPEIIIGLCDREAVRDVIGELNIGIGECAVQRRKDNKIVILAPDYTDLKMGLDYFLNNLSLDNDSNLIYSGSDMFSEIDASHIFEDPSDLASYKIVYDKAEENKSIANELVKAIKKNFSIDLELICETEPKSGREIIVGMISDKARFEFDSSKLNGLNYYVASSDTDILIAAEGTANLSNAVKSFIAKYIRTGNPISANLIANQVQPFNTFDTANDTDLYYDADTRIMSFNILSEEWDSAAVMPGRDIRVSSVIMNYLPDVAALQEVSNKWYTTLDKYLANTYKFTRRKTPSGSGTYTTLMYNTKTTKLIEEGIKLYSQGNSQRLRSIVWGVFESLSTGKRYIVCSTHWDASAGGPSVRLVQAKEMAEFAKEMQSKYGLDVFICGDYNAKENTTEYKTFIENSGFVDAKTDAKNIKKACNTYHTLFTALNTGSFESIDHITFSLQSKQKVLFYNTLYHDYIIDASDHCPIYIDIKLSD